MKQGLTQKRYHWAWISKIIAILLLNLLMGCNRSNEGLSAVQQSTPVVLTQTPPAPSLSVPTRILTSPEWNATKQAYIQEPEEDIQTRVAHATAFALGTPYPPTTPFALPTPPTPIPPSLGISGNCAQGNRRFEYGRPGCWAGLMNGEYIFVTAGARKSDLSQGLIFVYTSTLDLQTYGPGQWYSTPAKAGVVSPTEVTWPLMTLVAADNPQTSFIFDLTTHQWVSSPPLPTPSLSVSPLPTWSPTLPPIPSVSPSP